ncbi:MAG: SDR family oxidoreductase [Ilumatobacteraceae bacterium]
MLRALRRSGARVVVADLMTDAATETVQAVEDAGGEAVAVQLNASDQESNAAMMRTAVETFRRDRRAADGGGHLACRLRQR